MQSHQFGPTSDEIALAECMQRTTARKATGSFSTDAARRILKESGLSHRDIREICTIADRDGNGKLSNEELCAIIRLAGWVQQCGEKVSEHLLVSAGPLPVLKGVPYALRNPEVRTPEQHEPYRFHNPHDVSITAAKLSEPQQTGVYHFDQPREWHQSRLQPVYPAINVVHMQICRNMFERAGPINGLMDRETAQEVLMTRFNAPFFLLKTIFNLVRTSNRLSLNIFEFTLAAYFVDGLQSGVMHTLPSEVPRSLYDQLWTPILLNASPINLASGTNQSRPDSTVSAEESPVTSAQSSTSDLGLTAAHRLSPVRKEPHPSLSGHCPSVSSIERKKIGNLWKRVAEHCKIEKILKVPSTRYRKNKRESILSSDVSIKGAAYTGSSSDSSFEALERDSLFEPTNGQRVSMDITRLPLIYQSETGFYTVPGPMSTEVRYSIGGEAQKLDEVMGYSSIDYEGLYGGDSGETVSVTSTLPSEESLGYKAGVGKAEAQTTVNVDSDVVAMLKDMKEGYTFLKLQMQIMQKTVQKLGPNGRPTAKNVHFASNVEADLGERVRDSIQMAAGTSRRTQSLKISKKLVGPRDMLSIRSGSSVSSSRSTSRAYGHDYRRRHQKKGKAARVQGPRTKHKDSDSSSVCSLSSLEPLSEPEITSITEAHDYWRFPEVPDDSTNTAPPLRSILKVPADRPQTRRTRILSHDGHPSNAKNSPPTTPKHRKRATKMSGMTEETLQAWNARFIPVDRIIDNREGILVAKESRKLPRTPRKLPTPTVLPVLSKHSRSRHLPPVPMASSSKFPGALTDDGCSSSSHIDIDIESTSYFDSELSHVDTDTVPSSAASTPRSSADMSSIFSHRRHSARTTLLTEIDEYNDTVVRDLKEVAPNLVLHVEKCLLRELRTKSDGMYDGLRNGLEALSQSSMAQELEEALAQVRAKEEELKRLEDVHAEVLRQRSREVAKLEQEKDELQWTIAHQDEQISNFGIAAIASDFSIEASELPEYTPSSSYSEW